MSKTKTRVRLIDVAEKAKVSRAAVARVLLGTGAGRIRVGEEKAALIRKLATEMNFQPDNSAQMLAGKNSRIIGVLIDSYSPQVRFKTLSVAEEILAKEGFRLMIGQTHNNYDNFKSYIADFASRRVDAIICFAHEYPNFDVSKDFEGFKNVVFAGRPKLDNANFVGVNTEKGIAKLVKHLVETGRKKIGLWGSTSGTSTIFMRETGYKNSLEAEGIGFDVELLSYSFNNPPLEDDCQHVIDYLVKKKEVDAIIANNDIWAIKLIKSLKKNGYRVPEDVAIAGFDNIDMAELYDPELTSIDQNSNYQGQIIAKMILDMIKNKKEVIPRQILIEPDLIVRDSTKPVT
jgi:DNA-binding LacI/PurR family transcriptional regulator